MRKIRPFVPALILFAGCALMLKAHSQNPVPLVGSLRSVMSDVHGYDVTDQVLDSGEARVAGMSDYVARAYSRDSAVAFTTLVSYYDRQTHGRTIHSPRNCLPGAGWEVVDGGSRLVVVDGVVRIVNRYVLRRGRATAVAYYWYQGRGRVTANEYTVKWNLLKDAALLGHTEEALVRVVVPLQIDAPTGVDETHAMRTADTTASQVVARLIRDVDGVLPRRGARAS